MCASRISIKSTFQGRGLAQDNELTFLIRLEPPSSAAEQGNDQEKHDRAGNSDDEAGWVPAESKRPARDKLHDQTAKERADNTDDDVDEAPLTVVRPSNHTRDPSCQRAKEDPEEHCCHPSFIFGSTNCSQIRLLSRREHRRDHGHLIGFEHIQGSPISRLCYDNDLV